MHDNYVIPKARPIFRVPDLSLPVTSDCTDIMELNDLGNLGVAVGKLTIQCSHVNVQCTSDLAAAILDLSLPVTSDSVGNMIDMSG